MRLPTMSSLACNEDLSLWLPSIHTSWRRSRRWHRQLRVWVCIVQTSVENYAEFGMLRNTGRGLLTLRVSLFFIFFRFQQYFCSLTLEKRADVIVKAHIWMAKNIPMTTPLFMKTLASKGVSGRASIREPNTVGTMVASTCQFLRIINVDLGGAENLALAKTAVWTFVSEWLSEYSQQAGGDLSPMQKVSSFAHYYVLVMASFRFRHRWVSRTWRTCSTVRMQELIILKLRNHGTCL